MFKHVRLAIALTAGTLAPAASSAADNKNWTPPRERIYAQALSDATMKHHPDLLSVTLHGVPPGAEPGTYTMFAGSYPDRVGNADDPDDIDVSKKGITIVDPRWHRNNDPSPKFVVLMPMRDVQGQNIGLVVYAFKVERESNAGEKEFFTKALDLRDGLAKRIPNYAALFSPAR